MSLLSDVLGTASAAVAADTGSGTVGAAGNAGVAGAVGTASAADAVDTARAAVKKCNVLQIPSEDIAAEFM